MFVLVSVGLRRSAETYYGREWHRRGPCGVSAPLAVCTDMGPGSIQQGSTLPSELATWHGSRAAPARSCAPRRAAPGVHVADPFSRFWRPSCVRADAYSPQDAFCCPPLLSCSAPAPALFMARAEARARKNSRCQERGQIPCQLSAQPATLFEPDTSSDNHSAPQPNFVLPLAHVASQDRTKHAINVRTRSPQAGGCLALLLFCPDSPASSSYRQAQRTHRPRPPDIKMTTP